MPALTISNLKKTYPNGFTALKGVDLTVPQGEFFALLGANGAGKSTMIGIISSLFPQTDGTVQIFGVDLHKNPIWALFPKNLILINLKNVWIFSSFKQAITA